MKEFNNEKPYPQTQLTKSFNDSGGNDVYREIPPNAEVVYSEPILQTPPPYTSAARNVWATGSVLLKAIIDKEGHVIVQDVVTLLGLGLDENAVRAVSKWKFSPALPNSKPINPLFSVSCYFDIYLSLIGLLKPATKVNPTIYPSAALNPGQSLSR